MADVVDLANDTAEYILAREIARSRAAITSGVVGAEICDDCGDTIPMKRRVAMPGCTMCVACQRDYEEALKRG